MTTNPTPCAICYAASTPPGTPPPPVIRYCTWHAKEMGK